MKPPAARHLVWDVPVRLAHLLLLGGFAGAFLIAETSDEGSLFPVHMMLGLLVLVVAAFRVAWGIVGTRYARFGAFDWSPAAFASYLVQLVGGRSPRHVGHNPATSYAVVAILLLAFGIGTTGVLMTLGVGEDLEDVHEAFVFALLGVALVHVAGVIVHALRHRDDLVLSMIDGKKALATRDEAAHPAWGGAIILVGLALGILGLGLAGYDSTSGSIVIPGTSWRLGGSEGAEREQGDRDRHGEQRRHDGEHHERGDPDDD